MKSFVLFGVLFLTLVVNVISKEFPKDLKCPYGDAKCLKEKINGILKMHSGGSADISLDRFDPIDIVSVLIERGQDSPVNIKLNFKKCAATGFSDGELVEIKGFDENIKGPHEVTFKFPNIIVTGEYSINGRILVLPITGDGILNITLFEPTLKMQLKGKPLEKDGKTYLEITSSKVNINPKKVEMQLGNLFNGDKALGETTNKFLNENWSDIYKELQKPVESGFNDIISKIITKLFLAYPYEEFFANKAS